MSSLALDVEVAFHMPATMGEEVVAHLAIDGKQRRAHADEWILLHHVVFNV
jgi:hypothetical protein